MSYFVFWSFLKSLSYCMLPCLDSQNHGKLMETFWRRLGLAICQIAESWGISLCDRLSNVQNSGPFDRVSWIQWRFWSVWFFFWLWTLFIDACYVFCYFFDKSPSIVIWFFTIDALNQSQRSAQRRSVQKSEAVWGASIAKRGELKKKPMEYSLYYNNNIIIES